MHSVPASPGGSFPPPSPRGDGQRRRNLLIAGNWKMHKSLEEARALAIEIARGVPAALRATDPGKKTGRVQAAIFPAAVALHAVVEAVRQAPAVLSPPDPHPGARLLIGAQNIHFEKEGAFTGEISADMVLSTGAGAALIGHSERRHIFGEPDEWMGRKVERALSSGLLPVLCVGEKIDEREAGRTEEVIRRQLAAGIRGAASADALARVVIAYEPVWAIGTGKTATPAQGQEVHRFLRGELGKAFAAFGAPAGRAEEVLILYGGSVKPENAGDLLREPDIDGLLVGGASLKADSFLEILRRAAA